MEMEKLTTRNIAGVAVYKHPFECERCGETIWRLPDYGNGSPTEKLALRSRDRFCGYRARLEIQYTKYLMKIENI